MATSAPPVPADAGAVPPIILFVDDDRDTLEMYTAFFEYAGMWVATSTGPAEAVEAAAELKPDLIVTDLGFGGRPLGVDLVHTLKTTATTQHIPVIVLSGRSPDEVPQAVREEADLCLVKPVEPDALLGDIRSLIVRARALRDRGEKARKNAHRLAAKSTELLERAKTAEAQAESHVRRCPECTSLLDWIERGRVDGAEYDYYRWCLKGCGLFCYDRDARKWVKLA